MLGKLHAIRPGLISSPFHTVLLLHLQLVCTHACMYGVTETQRAHACCTLKIQLAAGHLNRLQGPVHVTV